MATDAGKGTLEYLLRPHALDNAEVVRRNPAVVPLVARLLGVVPRVFGYLEIWPPAFETYALVVPAFLDLPRCDAGLGLDPAMRSLAAYAASRGHGCAYCAAHCAAMGTVFSGAQRYVAHARSAVDGSVCALPSARERAVVELGLAVSKVPGPLDPARLAALEPHFKPGEIDQLLLVITTMGLLNRCLDLFGMVLERSLLEMADEHLAASGWRRAGVYDARFDAALMDADGRAVGLPSLGALALAGKLLGAVRFEARALGPVPAGRALMERLVRELGFVPAYIEHFRSQRVRRTLAHLLLERLNAETGSLPPDLRMTMGLVCARESQNPRLAAHFAYWASRRGGVEGVRQRLSGLGRLDDRDALALTFAERACRVPHRLDGSLVARLGQVFEPPALLELVLTVSIYSALHRLTLCLPSPALEVPVADFIAAHGDLVADPGKRVARVSERVRKPGTRDPEGDDAMGAG